MKFDIFPPVEKLTLDSINEFIQKKRQNGIEPRGIVLHFKQYRELSEEMTRIQRYVDWGDIAGMRLVSYRGIAIYPISWDDGYKCKSCGSGAAEAFLTGQKIMFCCKEHRNRCEMFAKFEESE